MTRRASSPPTSRMDRSMIRARLFAALLATTLTTAVVAQISTPEHGDSIYQPSSGQAGKDVVWVPTPDALGHAHARGREDQQRTTSSTTWARATARFRSPRQSSTAPSPSASSTTPRWPNSRGATSSARASRTASSIITGDIFVEDFSKATVVTMYLLPDLNVKLRPDHSGMKPGTRVTSHQFDMGDWEPDQRSEGRDPRWLSCGSSRPMSPASGR